MARNERSYRGLHLDRTTFKCDEALIKALEERTDCNIPLSVVLQDNGTVTLGKDGDAIYGFAYVGKNDLNVGIIEGGCVCDVIGTGLKATDTVVADGKGGVKKSTSPKPTDRVVISVSDHDGIVVKL